MKYNLTDLGNAQLFADLCKDRLLYCPDMGKSGTWYSYDGKQWVKDTGTLKVVVKEVIDRLHSTANSPEARKWAYHSESKQAIDAMLSLAKMDSKIVRHITDFNVDSKMKLNVLNGVIDLATGTIKPHNVEDYSTNLIPIKYNTRAQCPTWLRFLDDIMCSRKNLVHFLQKAIGYTLTASVSEQVMFIMYGSGANGKSTFIETIRDLLGTYSKASNPKTLMIQSGGAIRNDIARLQGSRFVSAVETSGKGKLDETMIKQITGDDMITARYLYSENIEFRPTWKVWLSTNHRPIIEGIDYGIWRRMVLIPFDATFKGRKKVPNMKELLHNELEGILRWAVEGCLIWQSEGLDTPEEIALATREYQEEMDIIGPFLQDTCFIHPEATVPIKLLYEKYLEWCRHNMEKPIDKRSFGKFIMARQGITQARSSKERFWRGIGIASKIVLSELADE